MCRRGCAPTICSASPTSAAASSSAPATFRELALGWCTYGVGDQMSHYGVNAGVPKTLIQYLIRWAIAPSQFDAATDKVLQAILDTEISPELVPADETGGMQSHRGPDRPLRAPRLLPAPHRAPRPAAVEGRLPRARKPGGTPRPGSGRSIFPRRRSANMILPRSANGWRSSCSASSSSASSSAARSPIRRRSRPAARSAPAATGARRATAMPMPGWRN